MRLDEDDGLDMLIEYKILSLVQLSQFVYDALIRRKELMSAMDE